MPVTDTPLIADLVLEGGGVKGIGLVGATAGLVDAGHAFPFERTDGLTPRWTPMPTPVTGPISLALAVVETMVSACDARQIENPCVQARTIFVDAFVQSPVDFGITPEQQPALLGAGRRAADDFLAGWDFPAWLTTCSPAGVLV